MLRERPVLRARSVRRIKRRPGTAFIEIDFDVDYGSTMRGTLTLVMVPLATLIDDCHRKVIDYLRAPFVIDVQTRRAKTGGIAPS